MVLTRQQQKLAKEKESGNMENKGEGGAAGDSQSVSVSSDQFNLLLTGITALQASISELRSEAHTRDLEIQQLRSEVLVTPSQTRGGRSNIGLESESLPQVSPIQIASTPQAAVPSFMESAAKLFPLPKFDGNTEEWPIFLSNFNYTTAEFNYTNRQNLMRLSKALEGKAKNAVTSMLIYPEDVPNIIKELEFNFGRPELMIKSQLQKVQSFPNIAENRMESILEFSNKVRNITAFFKSANCEHHLVNPILMEQLESKLPASKQYEWSRYASALPTFPNVNDFSKWLSELAKVVAKMPGMSTSLQANTQHTRQSGFQANNQSRRVLYNQEARPQRQAFLCVKCNQNHKLSECSEFQGLSINDKWAFVKNNHLCFSCLKKNHNVGNCRTKKVCGINNCSRMHHEMLHQHTEPATTSRQQEVDHVLNCREECDNCLFKILPVTLFGPKGNMSIWAMIDEGSSISLLEEGVANNLGLPGQASPLTLQWIGEATTTEPSKKITMELSGPNNRQRFTIKGIRTISKLNLPTQSFKKEQYCHLKELPIKNYNNIKPLMLLGLDNSFLTVSTKIVTETANLPLAAETKLGWVAYGPVNQKGYTVPRVCFMHKPHSLMQLSQLVEDNYSIENFGVKNNIDLLESDDNMRARQILIETTKKLNNKYEVGLLWHRDNVEMPRSYNMAEQRLKSLEGKMAKNDAFADSYKAAIAKYVEKGYARELTRKEAEVDGPTTWYLPHFGVINPHKPKKLRVVFDAAAAIAGKSLNAVLLKGPEQAQPLLVILHKFRQGKIAVAADIQEMFSQVRIRSADQNSQRFLWRDGNQNAPIRTFVMESMIFGAICSPCCAEYLKNLNANYFIESMPRGAKAVIESTYVDDLVISFDNVKEAEEVAFEAVKINAAAGFKLRNFVSNDKEIQNKLNECVEQEGIINMEPQSKPDKILGMFWNTYNDTFEFHFQFHRIPRDVISGLRCPTKRELLGIAMAIYDPFGLLSNITISVKLLVQATWKKQLQWDEQLPNEMHSHWNTWWAGFQAAKDFSVPRCHSELLAKADEVQLHVFVDASSQVYSAVAYLRIKKGKSIDVSLVGAKTRCAPLKGMTIPRLELQAALLGCRMKNMIEKCHDFKIHQTVLWSDSKTVILWLRSSTRKYKQFVACRIAEILSTTTHEQWRWVPTKSNAADEATRPHIPNALQQTIWVHGPDFLKEDEHNWPKEAVLSPNATTAEEEVRERVLLLKEYRNIIVYERFSLYSKLLRVTAWVLRFINNTSKSMNKIKQFGELKPHELNSAQRFICLQVQKEVFTQEINDINLRKCVSKSSSLHQLTPFLDEEGVLRVNGRIDSAYCLPLSARRPIILPKKHYITNLIVSHYHRKRHHQNDALVINEMRQTFWVPNPRAVLKSVKSKCPVCIIDKAKPAVPLMGQLPPDRLTPYVRPFTYAGVDLCGPFFVAIGRRREKKWVVLFTCLSTRAVHLEIAADLSTDAFLVSMRNFVNRRGVPCSVRCDNGTNFIGAQRELRNDERFFDFKYIERELAKDNVEWKFNCPSNPNAGGCWERLIQCVKRLLYKVLKQETPRLETFYSVLVEAENIVNSRPLTEIPVSTDSEEPLTPNHFLLGCLNSTQTPKNTEDRICLRKQWKIARNLKDRLWKRWVVEYLPQLICRQKWHDKVTPLKIGQLVLICDAAAPRSEWRKGFITEVHTANDGQVRSAVIKTCHGILRRPASKLAVLNLSESNDSPRDGM